MRIPLILFVFHYFYHYYYVSSIICRLSDQSMDRLICHVIQSCRDCTRMHRVGEGAGRERRTDEDEAPARLPIGGGGGGCGVGG